VIDGPEDTAMTTTMAAGRAFEAARRVWRQVTAAARHRLESGAASGAGSDEPLVSALCACVLGEHGAPSACDWPPRSVSELLRHADRAPTAELSWLLHDGLAALDEAAWQEARSGFVFADRSTQLRALFRLEAGQGRLSRQRAGAFIDAFLTLAARAYLHDALALAA
jgi:hypothetical protein